MNLLLSPNSTINYNIETYQRNNIVDSSYKLLLSNRHSLTSNLTNNHENFENKKFLSRGLWGSFINRYWQETIFLSKPSASSNLYMNQLKSDGVSIYGNQYKKFLFEFSKALMLGRISTSLTEYPRMSSFKKDSVDIKFIWRKGLNFPLNQKKHMDKKYIALVKKIKDSNLPLFTVTNDFHQIIIAEPTDSLVPHSNLLDSLYKWYCNQISFQKDTMPVHEGLFFVNLDDALEYKQYIINKYLNYGIYTNKDKLQVLSSSLDSYYKLVYKAHPKVYFRLIPDLKEMGELIYQYQHKKNVIFHEEQDYGKYHFRGQPIYIIEPTYCRNNITKTNDLVKYQYLLHKNVTNSALEYQTVFMNYKVALLAWRKFVESNTHYNLPKHPKILVYNLEDFLNKYVAENNNSDQTKSNILFVPNQDSYQFVKLSRKQKNYSKIRNDLDNNLLHLKVNIKRLVWSLTSRQPTNL